MVGQVKHARAENPLSRAYDATREERAAGEKRGALLCFSFSQRNRRTIAVYICCSHLQSSQRQQFTACKNISSRNIIVHKLVLNSLKNTYRIWKKTLVWRFLLLIFSLQPRNKPCPDCILALPTRMRLPSLYCVKRPHKAPSYSIYNLYSWWD